MAVVKLGIGLGAAYVSTPACTKPCAFLKLIGFILRQGESVCAPRILYPPADHDALAPTLNAMMVELLRR